MVRRGGRIFAGSRSPCPPPGKTQTEVSQEPQKESDQSIVVEEAQIVVVWMTRIGKQGCDQYFGRARALPDPRRREVRVPCGRPDLLPPLEVDRHSLDG